MNEWPPTNRILYEKWIGKFNCYLPSVSYFLKLTFSLEDFWELSSDHFIYIRMQSTDTTILILNSTGWELSENGISKGLILPVNDIQLYS